MLNPSGHVWSPALQSLRIVLSYHACHPSHFIQFPTFPSHWGLWVREPSVANPDLGKVIRVIGDAALGDKENFRYPT